MYFEFEAYTSNNFSSIGSFDGSHCVIKYSIHAYGSNSGAKHLTWDPPLIVQPGTDWWHPSGGTFADYNYFLNNGGTWDTANGGKPMKFHIIPAMTAEGPVVGRHVF